MFHVSVKSLLSGTDKTKPPTWTIEEIYGGRCSLADACERWSVHGSGMGNHVARVGLQRRHRHEGREKPEERPSNPGGTNEGKRSNRRGGPEIGISFEPGWIRHVRPTTKLVRR